MHKRFPIFLCILGLSLLACEPVIAIGWPEILIITGLVVFLLGPPLYKLYRRWEKFKSDNQPKNRQK